LANAGFDKLSSMWLERADWNDDEIDTMVGLWEGEIPGEFKSRFPNAEVGTLVNMVRLAWSDLATTAGRIPDLKSIPYNETKNEMVRTAKHEMIGYSYLREAEPSGKIFMWLLLWWLIGAGRAVALVRPNFKDKKPSLTLRDPRTCRPTFARTSSGMPVELDSLLFRREISREEARNLGLVVHKASTQGAPIGGPTTGMSSATSSTKDETKTVVVHEYIDKKWWMLASEGSMVSSEHGLGEVPGWFFKSHGGDRKGGISLFKDQISLMMAVSLLVSYKISAADRSLNPIYWAKGLESSLKIGPAVINKLADDGEIGRLDPPNQLQVDRDIEMLTQFQRVLNRNPETRQGEIANKGSYVSAKTVEQLAEAVDTVVGQYWDLVSVGMQNLLRVAFKMDEKLWRNVEKTVIPLVKGKYQRTDYTPGEDIDGNHHIMVEYGFGLGGYQGFLQMMQANQAKVMSRRRVIEEMPGVSDAETLMREIDLEDMDDAGKANFQQLAAMGQLDMILWAKLRDEMAKKGLQLYEVIEKYQVEIQEQAQAAVEGGGAEAITAAPGEGAPPQEEAGAPPGVPPSVLAGVG